MSTFTTSIINYHSVDQDVIARQVTLTQTITYADYTTTAVVTLARSDPPSATPPPSPSPSPSSRGPTSSDGIAQQQVAIIIGTVIGVIALVLLIWLCCVTGKRRRVHIERLENANRTSEDGSTTDIIQVVETHNFPPFPHSIPPPPRPAYRAVDPRTQWNQWNQWWTPYPSRHSHSRRQ